MIEAQDQLNSLKVVEYPNLKASDRKQYHKWLFEKAYPDSKKTVTVVTQSDLNRALGINNG